MSVLLGREAFLVRGEHWLSYLVTLENLLQIVGCGPAAGQSARPGSGRLGSHGEAR